MEKFDIEHVEGVKLGEIGWQIGTPVVPVGDVFIPEHIESWVRFPGAGDQPVLRLIIEVCQSVPRFTKVEIESKPDGRAVTGKDLLVTKENMSFWLETIVKLAAQRSQRDPTQVPDWADTAVAQKSLTAARRGAPRKITHDRLAQVADIYRANIEANPLEAIKDAYGVEHRTAARYVQLARKAELLPPTTPGKKKA